MTHEINTNRTYTEDILIAASRKTREKEFWMKQLAGNPVKNSFPFDNPRTGSNPPEKTVITFCLPAGTYAKLEKLTKGSDYPLFAALAAGITLLAHKYTGSRDILIGAPIYRQEQETGFINTVLVLRNHLQEDMSYKQLLLEMRNTIYAATENYRYPLELLPKDLNLPVSLGLHGEFPLFDIVIMLRNIHDEKYIQHIHTNTSFAFHSTDREIQGELKYNSLLYRQETMEQMINHLQIILGEMLRNPEGTLNGLEILTKEEKRKLLEEINQTQRDYPIIKGLHRLFEEQVEKIPDHVALTGPNPRPRIPIPDKEETSGQLSYRELNNRSNQLARILQKKGVNPNMIVGVILERSLEMIIGILAILKDGACYLPLDPGTPSKRIISTLEDAAAPFLLTTAGTIAAQEYSFTGLQGLTTKKITPQQTIPRPQITNLDALPFPDRSLVDYGKYHQYIGVAMAKHTIPLMATRGCPYNCVYCHKIWPKKHMSRSAENVFAEVARLYDTGIRRFVILDDIFNLNKKNSSRFYQLILDHGLKIQLFFPGGVRGDIMTREYIDLMIEAGTVNLMMALESASPRIQQLVGKNLDIQRFQENLQYIIKKHPQVILEVNIMMGFPGETEAEALESLNFIKKHQWIDFPNLNILKIYANTDMERLALESGITPQAIENSFHCAYHELPETLPFNKRFVLKCQAELFNEYFLAKERLLAVLPHQARVLSQEEMVRKYDSYLPTDIKSFQGLLDFLRITREEWESNKPGNTMDEDTVAVPDFHQQVRAYSTQNTRVNKTSEKNETPVLKVLLLDLSKTFSTAGQILYDVTESPLGLMYLLTYLNREFANKIQGKIAHARIDFDNYHELKTIIEEFRPGIIGVRTLTFYKDFYHQTIAAIRQWKPEVPIIAGGPYASSDWPAVLRDANIDLVVRGEGEITFAQVIEKIIENHGQLPTEEVLKEIPGILFIPKKEKKTSTFAREIIMPDLLQDVLAREPVTNLPGIKSQGNGSNGSISTDLAYVIFTSGSTGRPKGTITTHHNVVRVVKNTNYIDLTSRDRILQLSNYAFDGSVFDIYGALLNGSVLVMMDREQVLNLDQLSRLLNKENITVFFVTTALFNALVDLKLESLVNIRNVLFGGERVSLDHVRRAWHRLGKGKIIHMYGPTETTVYATYYRIDDIQDHQETIPIGKPLANTFIYVLDRNLKPVPLGVTGQICIGGDGNARGYLNLPGPTAEKFIDNPFVKGDRMYLSGDLGRWTPGGDIQFIGRIDQQVKIRGFRVEPGEIEKHLLNIPYIHKALVISKEEKEGERYLCAYVVPAPGLDYSLETGELRDLLARDLPGYMVPAYFVQLEEIPLTANGKINRKALPPPVGGTRDNNYAAAENPIEETLVCIWAEVLDRGKETIGIHDDFFQLGGHSLKATILISRIQKELQVNIPLAELFNAPTIRELAGYIKGLKVKRFSSLPCTEKKEYYQLSSAQQRLYIIQQMDISSTFYNVYYAVEIAGKPGNKKLTGTFAQLIKRYESLRTSFYMLEEKPVQEIHEEVEFAVQCYELDINKAPYGQKLNASGETSAHQLHQINENINSFIRPFDLSQAPLMRVGLIEMEKEKYILMVDIHHIVTDGTSMELLIKEFTVLYGGEKLPPLKFRYRDYSEWQSSREQKQTVHRQEVYWLQEFAGEIPVLVLPYDFPRPAIQDFTGDSISFELSAEETRGINDLAREQGITLYMVLLTATITWLSKLSNQEDIVVGTPIAARRHADLENIMGMFVNTLALRNYPQGTKTSREFFQEVKARTLQAFENQEYQFEELVERVSINRDASRNPLFDVIFVLENMGDTTNREPSLRIPGMKIKPYPLEDKTAKFDLTLACVEAQDKLLFACEYCSKLFKAETIRRYIAYFKRIISMIIKEPARKLMQIQILSEQEKNRLLIEFNEPAGNYPNDKSLQGLFAEQVERTPESIAITGPQYSTGTSSPWQGTANRNRDNAAMTYRELNKTCDNLARYLNRRGQKENQAVALMVERSMEMIVGILGILKAGSAYVPIDPKTPKNRIKYITAESQANLLLTVRSLARKTGIEQEPVYLDDRPEAVIGAVGTLTGHNPHPRPGSPAAGFAYIIFTSGSTGTPKGVPITHANLSPLLHWGKRNLEIGPGDAVIQELAYYFDWSVWEIFITITGGARLDMATEEILMNAEDCMDYIAKKAATVLHVTPTQYSYLIEVTPKAPTLKYLFIGAEKLNDDLVRRSNQWVNSECRIFNMYGPTEATIIAAVLEIDKEKYRGLARLGSIPIGQPVGNTQLLVLDKYLNLCPIRTVGELYIAGEGLAPGYLNDPEKTRAVFVENLYQARRGIKGHHLYKTNDLARWLEEGNIEFMGRQDEQVKIRGNRIEPGEIENRMLNHPGIKEAVVQVREDQLNDKYLCAYFVSTKELSTDEIRQHLSAHLPAYMIPVYFMRLERMPINPNGKIDRKALPAPQVTKDREYTAPTNERERKLVNIWSEVLGKPGKDIGIHTNFFELGGHSMKATTLISKIQQIFQVRVPLAEVFINPTIRGLAQYMENMEPETFTVKDPHLVLLRKTAAKTNHLFLVHDGSGEVEGYLEFCQHLHLDDDCNCWGLRSGMLGNDHYGPRDITIQEPAKDYIEKIKKVQPQGPYYIAGWSLGGTIAFEMALQLEEMGEKISFLGLIDAPGPQEEWKEQAAAFNLAAEINWIREYLPDYEIKEKVKKAANINEIWAAILKHLEENHFSIKIVKQLIPGHLAQIIPNYNQLGIRELIYYLNTNRTLIQARAVYIPAKKLKTTLYYFKAGESPPIFQEGWNQYCLCPIKSYEITGDHLSILKKPAVQQAAELIGTAFNFDNTQPFPGGKK